MNNKGQLKLIVAVVIFFLVFGSAVWFGNELKHSWKMNKEINNNNATCYLDRGMFNIPFATICTYNNTLILQKDDRNGTL